MRAGIVTADVVVNGTLPLVEVRVGRLPGPEFGTNTTTSEISEGGAPRIEPGTATAVVVVNKTFPLVEVTVGRFTGAVGT